MAQKSLNQILALSLRRLMAERGLSENELGRRAKVAPNTIGNYCNPDPQYTSKGKERSAKLAEIDRIAVALGVPALTLLTDPEELERREQAIKVLSGAPLGEFRAPPAQPAPRRKAAA